MAIKKFNLVFPREELAFLAERRDKYFSMHASKYFPQPQPGNLATCLVFEILKLKNTQELLDKFS